MIEFKINRILQRLNFKTRMNFHTYVINVRHTAIERIHSILTSEMSLDEFHFGSLHQCGIRVNMRRSVFIET